MKRRFICVASYERGDCGPAALAAVARYHGLSVSPLQIKEMIGCDHSGTDMPSLRLAAEALGFDAAFGTVKPGHLADLGLPAILQVEKNGIGHFVVIYRVDRFFAFVADPAIGLQRLPIARLAERWEGAALILQPGPRFQKSQPPQLFRRLLCIAATERQFISSCLWIAVAVTASAYGISTLAEIIFDHVITGHDRSLLTTAGVCILAVVAARALLSALRALLVAGATRRLSIALGTAFITRLFSLPASFFPKRGSGDMVTRLQEVISIGNTIGGPLMGAGLDCLTFVAAGTLICSCSAKLGLAVLLTAALGCLVVVVAAPILQRQQQGIREEGGALASKLVEMLANIPAVKAFGLELWARHALCSAYGRLQGSVYSRQCLASLAGSVNSLLTGAASVVVLWLGAKLAIRGAILPGQLVFAYSMSALCLAPLERMGMLVSSVADALVAIERVGAIFAVEMRMPRAGHVPPRSLGLGVTLASVSFSYGSLGGNVISDANLVVQPGENIAIVGSSGSGKTTLAYLIAGIYAPTSGEVTFNAIEQQRVDRSWLRSSVAVAFAEPYLFGGSVRENIVLDRQAVSQEQIEIAARAARAHDFVAELPGGYGYRLGPNGSGLSTGQRQRIALARALLTEPRCLVLDEATAALDPPTEQAVIAALARSRAARGATTVVVTHRIATVTSSFRIVVVSAGRIVAVGVHNDLLTTCGIYRRLWGATAGASPRAAIP